MMVQAALEDPSSEGTLVRERLETLITSFPDPGAAPRSDVLAARFDAGLAWVHHPVGLGGLGVTSALQHEVDVALTAAGLVHVEDQRPSQRGLYAPVLMRYGTLEQQVRYLRGLFTEEERWCLLLSEPNAGSDLGGISTRADQDGDAWVVNGQKVWTSMAHLADFGFLVARTDGSATRFAGLTAFILDMRASGVEVRPLRQLTGDAEFNEVFLSDVVVPDEQRVGDPGAGWAATMHALSSERFIIGHEVAMEGAGPVNDVLEAWNESTSIDPVERDAVARLWIEAESVRLYAHRTIALHNAGRATSEASVLKLAYTQMVQRAYDLTVDLMGPDGALYPDDYEFAMLDDLAFDGHDPRRNFLAARGRTIGGGTSEVLKNTLAERVLGLPREPQRSP